MAGGKHLLLLLLLLPASVFLGGGQSQTVVMFPQLEQVHIGDLFYLRCNDSRNGMSQMRWFHNDKALQMSNYEIKIQFAASKHSGTYRCEIDGRSSRNNLPISVLNYYPRASLTLQTGQPVMQPDGSVTLRLDHSSGLQGWNCFVIRGDIIYIIVLSTKGDNMSLEFQTNKMTRPENIFWCSNADKSKRSNQVTIRTSDKSLAMEMYFAPAIVGGGLILRCLSWDREDVSHVAFYKNNAVMLTSTSPTHRMLSVAEADQGAYRCSATLANQNLASDAQELFIHVGGMRPEVSGILEVSCSCPECPTGTHYMWYKMDQDNRPLKLPGNSQASMKPDGKGTYACAALWDSGRTLISKGHFYNPIMGIVLIGLIMLLVIAVVVAVVVFRKRKQRRRGHTGPLYEDVGLKLQEGGADRYERLQRFGAQKESEYDVIHQADPDGAKKEGHYEPLAKAGMDEGVYHTLGMEGGGGGAAAGGYEALQRKTMKDDTYHSIGMEGAAGGEEK
uniref:Uncharacterized LOC105419384 n=1 Tax=Takifugu rubripes TaxID=31033 RepID=A0A674MYF0_TAKRU